MNPISLAQSFLMDIAAGVHPLGEEATRERARQLALELELYRNAPKP